jgi:hypothetical protein
MNSSTERGLRRTTHTSGEEEKAAFVPSVSTARRDARFRWTAGIPGRSGDRYSLVPSSNSRHRDGSG